MAAVQPAASRGRVLVQAEVEPAEVCKWVALLSKLGVGNNVLAPKESAVLQGLTSWLAGLVPDAQNNMLGLTAARRAGSSKDDCLYYNDFLQSWQAAMPATRGTALGKQPISVSWMQALTSVAVHKAATAWKAKLQPRPDTRDPGALEAELHNISDWDSYDALKVRELSHGRPLELTALSLIIKLQLDTRLKLDLNKLRTFLASIEAQYPSDNPYHNAMHAADVVQGVGCIITADEFGQKLTDLEVLALILSAVVHDVAHPGVNNIFLVRAETEAALHYNDNSVNENTHLVKAFSTLRENNFLEGLNDEDRKFLRRLIIEMVLGTDMAFHNAMLKDFANRMTLAGVDIETWENEGRAALLKFVLHAADISNPARPWTVCRFWAQQITTENFLQGERERQAGLTVSPMCDKEKAVPIKSQQIFCELFVKPTFQTLSAIAPNISAKALGHCATNSTRYQAYADKGMMQIPVE